MSTQHSEDAAPARARRRWRGPLVALGVLLALVGALELALRASVHVQSVRGWPLLGPLGAPENFGDYASDDAHWEARFWRTTRRGTRDHPKRDARLGWRSGRFAEGTLEHQAEAALAGRRPVLLFGDSFAEGIWPDTADDFTPMFARTDLAGEFGLLNYGVGGYGLDQIVLLAGDALERHRERRPVVLLSLLVEDDLDRSVLAFRLCPKPRLRLKGGSLVGEESPVPTMAEYLARDARLEPLHLVPFVGALRDRLAPERRAQLEAEKQELARALLERAVAELRAADVPFLVVLFRQGQSIEDPGSCGWRARLCAEVLEGLGAPWVDVGPAFRAHAELSGREVWDYFLPSEHPGAGHYNPLGDAVALAAVREGLREHLGLGRGGDLRVAQDVRPLTGDAPIARWREDDPELEALGLEPPFLELERDAEGRGGLVWDLGEDVVALRARVHLVGEGELRLRARRDGADAGAWTVTPGASFDLQLDLAGARALELSTEGLSTARVVLGRPTLELAGRLPPPLD